MADVVSPEKRSEMMSGIHPLREDGSPILDYDSSETGQRWQNDNGSAGRHWGYRGVELTRAEVALTRDQMVDAQRFLRSYIKSQKRTMRTKGFNGQRSRPVNRRWRLTSLTGLDTGFTLLTNDGPALAVALARALEQHQQEETTWPPRQRRPLP